MNLASVWSAGTSTFYALGRVMYLLTPGQADPSEKILDPISTIVKMALLSFVVDDTKLHITENRIKFQQPTDYLGSTRLQGTWRRLNGLSHEDYAAIEKAIFRATEWFLPKLPKVEKDPKQPDPPKLVLLNEELEKDGFTIALKELPAFKRIFKAASRALSTNLSKTYKEKSPTTSSMIDKWVVRIELGLTEGIPQTNEEANPMAKRLRTFWKPDEIDNIAGILTTALEKQGKTNPNQELKCSGEFEAIKAFLKSKDEEFAKIVREECAKATSL